MSISIPRLAPVFFALLSACSSPRMRPPVPEDAGSSLTPQFIQEKDPMPHVVTVPIETGLETVPRKPESTEVMSTPLPTAVETDMTRPADASDSPYPASVELPITQNALPPIEPVIDPGLPAIDFQPTPDPAPIRTLSPRVGEKLFLQSAPPAVAALENDIEAQFKGRNYGDAAAQIDRALRIQPKNPELWHVLAEIRLRQNQPGLAEDLAKKSNSLAKSNADLVKSNWRIIADARRQKGDGVGAQDALEKAW